MQKGQAMTKDLGPVYPPRDPAIEDRTLRLENALRRSEKLAMAGRLAASVMHEINNPSQAIGDLVYLIAKEADHPELVRARAAQIEEQLVRIQYIARQTLSFFRDTPQTQAKDLVALVDSALLYHAGMIRDKRVRLIKSLPDTLTAWVYPGEFLQLVSNLLRNAVEALPEAGTLRVKLRSVRTAAGAEARLTVSDSGCGIPAAIKSRMFEAFQTDKAESGNGLGLWISKTIAEKHGGKIRFRSSLAGVARGTTFRVILPLENTAPGQQQSAPSSAFGVQ
jgi:signal transduction histidine kinase